MKLRTLSLCALVALGCSDDPAGVTVTSSAPAGSGSAAAPVSAKAPAGSASAAVSAAAPASAAEVAAPPPGPPVCTRTGEKAWGEQANKAAGLTTKGFKGTLAVGLALGLEPKVLTIDPKGAVKLLDVKKGAKLKAPEKGGWRNVQRVSPRAIGDKEARAFVDFRDDYKDKRRHVSCGPSDSDDDFLEFDGISWLDLDPKPTGEEKTKKYFSWKKLGGYVELRDCRTFVTLDGDQVWALGSVLRGTEKPDGTNEWKMVLVVDFGKNDEEIVLSEQPLKGDPPTPATFEVMNSRRVGDQGFVFATRFGGVLMAGALGKDRAKKGVFHTYSGYPSVPDIAVTPDDVVISVGIGSGKERSLKSLSIDKKTLEIPKELAKVVLPPLGDSAGDASFSMPELTVDAKGQRWLLYVEGPKDKGHLRIVPVGKDLAPVGRPFAVTDGDVYASEGRLQVLESGALAVAYIRDRDGKSELVTEELSCEVKP